MSFSKDALLHKLQDEIDSLFDDNIVIPKAWYKNEDGKTVYDFEHMHSEFEEAIDKLWSEDERQG